MQRKDPPQARKICNTAIQRERKIRLKVDRSEVIDQQTQIEKRKYSQMVQQMTQSNSTNNSIDFSDA